MSKEKKGNTDDYSLFELFQYHMHMQFFYVLIVIDLGQIHHCDLMYEIMKMYKNSVIFSETNQQNLRMNRNIIFR